MSSSRVSATPQCAQPQRHSLRRSEQAAQRQSPARKRATRKAGLQTQPVNTLRAGLGSAPKLSVRVHLVDAHDRLALVDHVIIVGSASRPASVIAMRVIGRLPRPSVGSLRECTRSLFLIANPTAISFSIVSTFTPRAESIVVVQPPLFRARTPSAWRQGGRFVFGIHPGIPARGRRPKPVDIVRGRLGSRIWRSENCSSFSSVEN